MTGTGRLPAQSMARPVLAGGWLLLIAAIFLLFMMGCLTTQIKQEADEPVKEAFSVEEQKIIENQAIIDDQARQIALLESRNIEMDRQVRKLNSRSKAEKVARESLTRRLEAAQDAREDAIREVVRVRARIQGMASKAEASAMFAEARVILDRMEEEAYSAQALEDLSLARSYMARGKGTLDMGNPGGAAYLFDLIPGLYEGMKKSNPRTVKVNVSVAALRKSPAPSASKVHTLYWGESVTGLLKNREWMKVKTASGHSGWLMRSQVQ